MPTWQRNFNTNQRLSFVLMELVIVLLIVGVVYTLMIANLSKKHPVSEQGFFNLREWIKTYKSTQESTVTLVCLEQSKRCFIEENRRVVADNVQLPVNITELYYFDEEGNEFDYIGQYGVRYEKQHQETVKFIFSYYPNNVSTPCLVRINQVYYTYFPYFQDIQKFDDFSDARRYLRHEEIRKNWVYIR
jgi:competence protein ComGC